MGFIIKALHENKLSQREFTPVPARPDFALKANHHNFSLKQCMLWNVVRFGVGMQVFSFLLIGSGSEVELLPP
jgi:hypothetical protein